MALPCLSSGTGELGLAEKQAAWRPEILTYLLSDSLAGCGLLSGRTVWEVGLQGAGLASNCHGNSGLLLSGSGDQPWPSSTSPGGCKGLR